MDHNNNNNNNNKRSNEDNGRAQSLPKTLRMENWLINGKSNGKVGNGLISIGDNTVEAQSMEAVDLVNLKAKSLETNKSRKRVTPILGLNANFKNHEFKNNETGHSSSSVLKQQTIHTSPNFSPITINSLSASQDCSEMTESSRSINSGLSRVIEFNKTENRKSAVRYDSMDAMRSRLSIIQSYDRKFNSNHSKWFKITTKGLYCEACGKTLKDSYKVFEASDKVRIITFKNI
jgi:hypothetical protein